MIWFVLVGGLVLLAFVVLAIAGQPPTSHRERSGLDTQDPNRYRGGPMDGGGPIGGGGSFGGG